MQKNIVSNIFKHIKLVSKHKWLVFKFSCKLGIPFRGFMHDFSKFSIQEFCESVKYYHGSLSPITMCKKDLGYSPAWLHHKGRNKHHFEYWEDLSKFQRIGVFPPYKYIVEAVCDKIGAGKTYNRDKWTQQEPYDYWTNIEKKAPVTKHHATIEFMDIVLKKIADGGLDSGLNKKFLKETYNQMIKKYEIRR